ncbi:MAG: FadR/GntR family transcriptional regulator [Alphaproteobacteria bacterium]|jgi:GntR family transcriptional repressor for pyruvate dehydrogenase complex|nr:FadR/GntR family transcriptional regulator [Alphaproteobacteria bacterium]MDP6832244.1 FadR/GntR family transcriptional regulator [Alphaproteobacteria bacterium]MDP6876582.1 FadR/GntR family transcriptional regulator [Alphaproteobacteria bacterium]
MSETSETEPRQDDPFRQVERATVSDTIVAQIRDLITNGTLKPGDRLPSERDLCKRFGVGRTSVREALKPLITMGLLEGRVGSGTFVAGESGQFQKPLAWGLLGGLSGQDDLVETRHMLETNAAYWAALRAAPENLAAIQETIDGMAAHLQQPDRFQDFDANFHFEIARATQNKILFRLINVIRGQIQTWIGERLALSPDRAEALARISLSQHEEILAAIKSGDGEKARGAMDHHIQTATRDLQTSR